ncbi:5-oxoprolinase subunit PxpB [soil metagenome]|nr:5-oxoprolinase subunit PxpB [Chthoniobacterales bacterium]
MEILPLGDSALLVRLGGMEPLVALERLRAADLPGVVEMTSAYGTIALFCDAEGVASFEHLTGQVQQLLTVRRKTKPRRAAPHVVEIPVCYDGEFALDLEHVAQHCGLRSEDVIRCHNSPTYVVSCIGFTPGFPYLNGLPAELATPRRATPRKEVPAGSVAIGGPQTGIYPQKSPGGWNVVGRTPLRLFDVAREQPSLLAPGDQVKFVQISRGEFETQCR